VELQGFEDLQAAHAQRGREIRRVTPAGCPDGASVQPGSFRGKFALLQQGHLVTILGKIAGGRGTRDPAPDDEDIGLLHMALLCVIHTQCIILHSQCKVQK